MLVPCELKSVCSDDETLPSDLIASCMVHGAGAEQRVILAHSFRSFNSHSGNFRCFAGKDQHGGAPTVWRWLNMSWWAKENSYILRKEEKHQQNHKPEAQRQVCSPLPSAWICPRFLPPQAFKSLRKCSFINNYEKNKPVLNKQIYLQLCHQKHWMHHSSAHSHCVQHADTHSGNWRNVHKLQASERNCARQVKVSSKILRWDRKHQHGNSGFALYLCLSALINNSNIGGCRGGQTEALITGTTRLFRLCKHSKWIEDLPAGKSFQPEKEQKRSQVTSEKES